MKSSGILNPLVLAEIAALGHTEYLCIADCGLPIPKGVKVIDLSVTAGVPAFGQVLSAVSEELVIESYVFASETGSEIIETLEANLGDIEGQTIPHEMFKQMCGEAKCIIRTGEATPYANVILVGGVNF